jgi:hypothetical protein
MVSVTRATRLVCSVAALAFMCGVARAEDPASRIAIESYSGPRPREVRQAMAALRDALTARRFVSQPSALTKLLGEQAPQPGVSDRQFTSRVFAREIDAGENLYIDENYKAAASKLGSAIDRVRRNSEILREAQSRELKLKGLVLLAQSYGRWSDDPGDRDAQAHAQARDDAMLEVHRSYPNREITVKQFGPEGARLWRAVADAPRRTGRGRLSVRVNDPDVLIYVDEVPRGNGAVVLGDLVPGPYRVLLVPPSGTSRVFTVTVPARSEARLDVDWDVTSVLVVGEDYVGFNFETDMARKREGDLARRFAHRRGAVMVAVLTVNQSRRRLAIVGSLYSVWSGRLVRNGMVELGAYNDAARIEQLAGYLDPTTDASTAKLVTQLSPGDYVPTPLDEMRPPVENVQRFAADAHIERHEIVSSPATTPAPVRHWHEIALVGSGLLAGGFGAYLIAIDGDPTCGGPPDQCKYVRDTGRAGWAFAAAGTVALGVGVWLHLRHPSRPAVVAVPGRGGGVAVASWRF